MYSVLTVHSAARGILEESGFSVSPLQMLNALAGSNLIMIHVWERRIRRMPDLEAFLTIWSAGMGLMLCWILGLEVLAGWRLL
jgi:hypothetical protein